MATGKSACNNLKTARPRALAKAPHQVQAAESTEHPSTEPTSGALDSGKSSATPKAAPA
jgi:hypothetical protein